MSRRFAQVDVFSEAPCGGNPVAVVLDAEGLDDAAMQRFAAWTNLSETTFVLPPTVPEADYAVRIFTPTRELPFAGHPTLGTCHAWLGEDAADGRYTQECEAGLIPVRRAGGMLAFAAPPLRRTGPVEDEVLEHLLQVLQLERDAVVDAHWVDNGPPWVAVLLESAERVLAVEPLPSPHDIGVVGPCPPGDDAALEVRAFFLQNGASIEDPVTGSLNASLADWLLRTKRVAAPYVARQGTALGRTGRVHVDQDPDGTIWVGGATSTLVRGAVDLRS